MIKTNFAVKKVFWFIIGLETLLMFCVMSIALLKNERPSLYFDEGSLVTYVSGFQFLLIAFIAHKIGHLKKGKQKKISILWKIFKFGFIYLAIDEIFMIHERLDFLIVDVFSIKETFLTKRIDDIIAFLYMGFSFLILHFYRNELKKYRKAFPLFALSIFLFMFTVSIDLINHSPNDLSFFINDEPSRKIVYRFVGPVEEMFKIWFEGVLLTAFYYCWKITDNIDSLKIQRLERSSKAKTVSDRLNCNR